MDIKTIQSLNIPGVRDVSIETSNIGPIVKITFFKEGYLDKAIAFFLTLFGEEKNPVVDYQNKTLMLEFNLLRS